MQTAHRRMAIPVFVLVLVSACSGGGSAPTTTEPEPEPIVASTPATTDPTPTTDSAPGSSTTTSTTPTTTADPVVRFAISVEAGEVIGGGRLEVPLGSEVEISISSDVTDHVHLHGYDVLADVAGGSTAVLAFTADIPGIFEVELEEARLPLAELEIAP